MIHEIKIRTTKRNELIDITEDVRKLLGDAKEGAASIHIPHTTAAVTINENADPDVCRDILWKLAELFPHSDDYKHIEGNSDAHLKSSIIGCSAEIMIKDGKLMLGRWQSIFLCEFDGPRERKIWVRIRKDE